MQIKKGFYKSLFCITLISSMDLKDFQYINEEEKKKDSLLSHEDHDDGDKILKELEERITKLTEQDAKKDAQELEKVVTDESLKERLDSIDTAEEEVVEEVLEEESFLDKIKPFIIPIFLTLFALIFSAIFMYFFSKSRIQQSVTAITNQNNQPEVIVVKEEKPVVKEPVIIEEPVKEPEPEPEPPKKEPEKIVFEDGTTTVLHVRFSFDKYSYDNHPRGIYLTGEQIFEGDYEDYKLIASNRPFANDYFFGIDRYTVSLVGDCQYVVDDAQILVSNATLGDRSLNSIGKKYFKGTVKKVLDASKPHVVCEK
jgi:hypothetical protein